MSLQLTVPQQQQRPLSARGAALPLADRVALYCRQTSAANNAGVMRNVAKPSAPEMLEFLTREATAPTVYGNPSLVRVLLTDSDYDSVCREVLSLSDAIEWHSQQADTPDQPQSPSTATSLEMMFQSVHVFSDEEMAAARRLAIERGLESVVQKVTEHGSSVDGDDHGGDDAVSDSDEVLSELVKQQSDSEEDEGAATESSEASQEACSRSATPSDSSESDRRDVVDRLDEHEQCGEDPLEESARECEELQQMREDAVDDQESADAIPKENQACEDSTAEGVVEEPTMVDHSTAKETTILLTETESPDIEPPREFPCERMQPSALDEAERSRSNSTEAARAREEVSTENVSDDQSSSAAAHPPPHHSNPHIQAHGTSRSESLSLEEPSSATLTHSASTVERIVRTLDKQILQSSESDEQDATIERAITHDATLLERRYSAIAEEAVANAADSSPHLQLDDVTPDASPSYEEMALTTVVAQPTVCAARELAIRQEIASLVEDPAAPPTAAPALSSAVPTEPPTTATLQPIFRVGEAVEARYRGWNRYFQGEIAVVVDSAAGVYEVRYADGDYEINVPADFIRPLVDELLELTPAPQASCEDTGAVVSRYAIGDQVEALYRGRTRWYPGRVTKVESTTATHSVTYDIAYDDGEMETGVADHHVRPRPASSACNSASSTGSTMALIDSATTLIKSKPIEADGIMIGQAVEQSTSATKEEMQQVVETARCWRIGDRVRVQQISSASSLVAWIIGVPTTHEDVYDVLYDAGGGGDRAGEKESGVVGSRIQRVDENERRAACGNQAHECDAPCVTPVLPFYYEKPEADEVDEPKKPIPAVPPIVLEATRLLAQDDDEMEQENESQRNVLSELSDDPDSDSGDDSILQSTALFKPSTPRVTQSIPSSAAKGARSVTKATPVSIKKPTAKRKKQPAIHDKPQEPILSEATLRYFTPQTRKPVERPRTGRSQAATTPRAGTAATNRGTKPKLAAAAVDVSWKELEEWKNVDLILNRKRKIVNNGHVEGSDVPWGEEFAAIQSLKRFANQYPDVLRQHIEHQLEEVVKSSTATSVARPMATSTTAAARDALLLIKDLAFLLRHRLAPFLDTILPVVLPAVFHSQKRFLCDTAYQVLEALVAHCSSRKLVVALLKQALRFPRDDMRLVNLTCLYVEKCLTSLSFAAVHELMMRSAVIVLEAIADLLGCKSAACQSSLQKSLLLIQQAIGDDSMESLLEDHLVGNELAIVQKHLALAVSTACHGPNKSPPTSPKKLQATPAKQAAVAAANAANAGGSMSILQRMLLQRQNRVVPAPE